VETAPAEPAPANAPAPVKQKETFDPSHKYWKVVLEKMASGVGSIAELQKTYIVPAASEEAIKDYLKKNIKHN
jgi:hypothetical protein